MHIKMLQKEFKALNGVHNTVFAGQLDAVMKNAHARITHSSSCFSLWSSCGSVASVLATTCQLRAEDTFKLFSGRTVTTRRRFLGAFTSSELRSPKGKTRKHFTHFARHWDYSRSSCFGYYIVFGKVIENVFRTILVSAWTHMRLNWRIIQAFLL